MCYILILRLSEFIVCFCYYINSILIDKKTKMILFKSVLLSYEIYIHYSWDDWKIYNSL